jgi:Ca2+-binding RTX toxin-like protein
MAITIKEAADFAKLAYAPNGGLAPKTSTANWVKLPPASDPLVNLSRDGYFGSAYVKLENGVAKELVIAHRGTEPTDTGDLKSDIDLSLGKTPAQTNHANAYVAAIKNIFSSQYPDQQLQFNDLTTHVGHSLGGYLAIRAADAQAKTSGVAVDAFTFDNPKSGLTSTPAKVISVLNSPNYINTAGTGAHVGSIFRIDTNYTLADPAEAFSVANLASIFINDYIADTERVDNLLEDLTTPLAGFNSANRIIVRLNGGGLVIKSGVALTVAAQTLYEHGLDGIIARLNNIYNDVNANFYNLNTNDMLRHRIAYERESGTGEYGDLARQFYKNHLNYNEWSMTEEEFRLKVKEVIQQLDLEAKQDDKYLILGDEQNNELIGDSDTRLIIGGDGKDRIFAGNNNKPVVLSGGEDTDLLVAGGYESHLHGEGGQDIFALASRAFVQDGAGEDFATWNGLRVTGGVQQWWQEGDFAYYAGVAPLLTGGIVGNLFASMLTLINLPMTLAMRYGMTESGQLLIQQGRGRAGVAIIEDYDWIEGTAGISVLREVIVEGGNIAEYQKFAKMVLKAAGLEIKNTDPLVIDMDGNGVELSRMGSAKSVYLDSDNNGFRENMGWVRGGDAVLVRDVNNNGRFDGWGELFGNATQSGFAALRGFDSNADGRISSVDSQFGRLKVWVDANHNGVSDAGEMRGLAQAGISSISLSTRTPTDSEVRGNQITAEADVQFSDGSKRIIADVVLQRNPTDTKFAGNLTVSTAASALPQLKGYGEVADLRVAMTSNSTLLNLVSNAANQTNWTTARSAVETILYNWAGVAGVATTDLDPSTTRVVTARQLAFLEKYFGMALTPRNATGAIQMNNGGEILQSWNEVLDDATLRIMVQGGLKGVMSSVNYNIENELTLANADGLAAVYRNIFNGLPTGTTGVTAWRDIWSPIMRQLHGELQRADGIMVKNDFVVQSLMQAINDVGGKFQLSDIINGLQLTNVQISSATTSTINRNASGANGAEPSVYVINNTQNITINGGVGQDVILLGRNFGNITINDIDSGQKGDRIRFTEHLENEIKLQRIGDDLLMTVISNGKTIRVVGHYETPIIINGGAQMSANKQIEEIHFADGKKLEIIDIQAKVGLGTNGADTINGTAFADEIEGLKGNDLLQGGDAGDSYYYTIGDGNDTIVENITNPYIVGADSLFILGGVTSDDVRFNRTNPDADGAGRDLLINVGGGSITIKNQFIYGSLGIQTTFELNPRIEGIFFEQGQGFNWFDIQREILQQSTTAGNDTIIGYGTSDVLSASAGNDFLKGLDGGDVYHYELGSGNDTIHDASKYPQIFTNGFIGVNWDNDDTLRFGDGIKTTDITFQRLSKADDLTIKIAGQTNFITVKDQFDAVKLDLFNLLGIAWFDRIEKFEFADGTVQTWEDVLRIITKGDAGNNSIYGAMTNDTIIGGKGNDLLVGADGSDIYIYNFGDGNDTIHDERENVLVPSQDILRFGSGIGVNNTIFSRANGSINNGMIIGGDDLIVSFNNSSERITIKDFYEIIETGPFGSQEFNLIERFEWADGTSRSWNQITTNIINSAKTSGNDTIFGTHFDDTIAGGTGNDLLVGDNGSDIYQFNRGDGVDSIYDLYDNILSDNNDVILFGANIAPSDIILQRVGGQIVPNSLHGLEDLRLSIRGTNDAVILREQFDYNTINFRSNEIENIRFSNGTNWSARDVQLRYIAGQQTSGNDVIEGFWYDDTIIGGAGNDTLRGGDGSDTYNFSSGFGSDLLQESVRYISYDNNDVVSFDSTINRANMRLSRGGENDLIISFTNNSDRLTIKDQFLLSTYFRWHDIETFRFADGTTLDDAQIRTTLINQATTTGNDSITGFAFAETFNSSLGNDTLAGLGGGDTYIFASTFGNDVIQESIKTVYEDAPDRIRFTNHNLADVKFTKVGEDLLINIVNKPDSILVSKHFNAINANKVEFIEFANGNVIETTNITQTAITNQATAGNDVITGTNGRDTLAGLAGNDTLSGGENGDIYYFSDGFGQDIIRESKLAFTINDDDTIAFAGNLTSNKVQFSRVFQNSSNSHLIVRFQGVADQITIEKQFNDLGYNDVETFIFADGVTITDREVKETIIKNLTTGGNDSIVGFVGDDIFTISAGNDTLVGETGNDTYHFARGMGQDFIRDVDYNNKSLNDVLQFGSGISINDLNLSMIAVNSGNSDLLIQLKGSTESVRISDQFDGGPFNTSEIEIYRFADGSEMTNEQIRLTYLERASTSGNDVVQGSNKADIINGLSGNDSLIGAHGNDSLIGGIGKDTLNGGVGNDRFIYNATSESQIAGNMQDIIQDFSVGFDKIDLTALNFNSFQMNIAATASDGFLRGSYNATTRVLTVTNDQSNFQLLLERIDATKMLSDSDFLF